MLYILKTTKKTRIFNFPLHIQDVKIDSLLTYELYQVIF